MAIFKKFILGALILGVAVFTLTACVPAGYYGDPYYGYYGYQAPVTGNYWWSGQSSYPPVVVNRYSSTNYLGGYGHRRVYWNRRRSRAWSGPRNQLRGWRTNGQGFTRSYRRQWRSNGVGGWRSGHGRVTGSRFTARRSHYQGRTFNRGGRSGRRSGGGSGGSHQWRR
jgi:hypothetical protein